MTAPASGAPVVVVGAGPVGLTGALMLARWGLRVVVLDARPARDSTGSKAICQQRDVLDAWASVGDPARSVGATVAAEGVTWTTARTYHRDRELFSYAFVDRGRSPFPPFVNISQARVESLLDAAVAASPLIEVRWGWTVVGLTQSPSSVSVRCLVPAGGLVSVDAPYVLACAGGHGDEIRGALGLDFAGQTFDDRFLICDIRTDLPGWETERRFFFDPSWNPGRQVLIHPCPDSTYRIDWQVPPSFSVEHDDLDARIRQVIGDRPYSLVWQSVYRFHSRIVNRMRVGRVLLAGDCAHLMAPFGARGLNSGVQDVENAAWKLAYVLRGWAPASLLDSYDAERHAAARENLEITDATMRFLVPRDPSWRQSILERASWDPAARSLVDSGRLAEPYWYVDSPLTTPDPSRPFAGRPPRGELPPAAPGVLVPDAPIRHPAAARLRELARDGFLVLASRGVSVDGPGPVRVVRLADVDVDGVVAEALGARPGEAWVIRPDGHVAAVVPEADRGADPGADRGADPGAVAAAIRRACHVIR